MKKTILFSTTLIICILFTDLQAQNNSSDRFIVKNPADIYIGAILDSKSLNADNHKFLETTLNPIEIISIFSAKSETISPSYSNMMSYLNKVLQDYTFKQNIEFSATVREIKSYNEIPLFFGQSIDMPSYFNIPKGETLKKNAVVVDINQTILNIIMDIPENLPKDSHLENTNNDLIYVNSLKFGRKATAIIESTTDINALKGATNDFLNNKDKASAKNKAILANSTIRIMIVGNQNPVIEDVKTSPLMYLIKTFTKPFSITDFGTPISFTAAYLSDHSVFTNKF